VRRLRDRLHGHQAADVLLDQVQHGGVPATEAGGGAAYQDARSGVRLRRGRLFRSSLWLEELELNALNKYCDSRGILLAAMAPAYRWPNSLAQYGPATVALAAHGLDACPMLA
jgi:hypothetical protein